MNKFYTNGYFLLFSVNLVISSRIEILMEKMNASFFVQFLLSNSFHNVIQLLFSTNADKIRIRCSILAT